MYNHLKTLKAGVFATIRPARYYKTIIKLVSANSIVLRPHHRTSKTASKWTGERVHTMRDRKRRSLWMLAVSGGCRPHCGWRMLEP